jgi:hypothetical protein
MPRDGSNIYHRPVGTDGVPNYPIESTKYNANVADVEQDLNLPRPVVAGGTGATNAADARFNIAAETATQIVTSYDTQVWMPGSFQSAVGATGAPNSTSVFAGVCYLGEALANPPTNQNVVIEARDISSPIKPGPIYTRQKTAGVWSAWGTSGGGTDDASNRAAIYAAPFDALAYNGMQINGSMEVSQERGFGAGAPASQDFICDGWRQYTDATSVGIAGFCVSPSGVIVAGLGNRLEVAITAAGTPTGTQYVQVGQSIEGYRASRLGWGLAGPQSITIGFWTAHNRTGIYSVVVRNDAQTRSYAATYTQNASDTWEYKTVTIPGCTDGIWQITNLVGIRLNFPLACGPGGIAPTAGAWYNAAYFAAPGQVNSVASGTDKFRLTGVVVLPGIEAPSAARSPLIMRPYDQELLTCQRYWEKISGGYRQTMTSNGCVGITVPFKVMKRSSPTMAFVSNGAGPTNSTFNAFGYTDSYTTAIQFTGSINTESFNWGFTATADIRL